MDLFSVFFASNALYHHGAFFGTAYTGSFSEVMTEDSFLIVFIVLSLTVITAFAFDCVRWRPKTLNYPYNYKNMTPDFSNNFH